MESDTDNELDDEEIEALEIDLTQEEDDLDSALEQDDGKKHVFVFEHSMTYI